MKILVIEDLKRHQEAAKFLLPEATVANYAEAYELLEFAKPGEFDVVLTDMYFKIGPHSELGGYFGSHTDSGERPFGLAFTLKAVELGIPVGLVSHTNHHDDIMAGMMDFLVTNQKFVPMCGYECPIAKNIGWDDSKITECDFSGYEYSSDEYYYKATDKWPVKDWRTALEKVIKVFNL